MDINTSDSGGEPLRRFRRMYEGFVALILILVAFMLIMGSIWITAAASYAADQPVSQVTQFSWAATGVLIALFGLCAGCVLGLCLAMRPAVLAQIATPAGVFRNAEQRRWPRLSGLAQTWAGLGMVGYGVAILTRVGPVPFQGEPPSGSSLLLAGTLFGATIAPMLIIRVAARLLPGTQR